MHDLVQKDRPGLTAAAAIGLVRLYQQTASPVLPVLFGPSCGCRFSPTCSEYAIEALGQHGAAKGTFLAAKRLIRCTPLSRGGVDPVPSTAH